MYKKHIHALKTKTDTKQGERNLKKYYNAM